MGLTLPLRIESRLILMLGAAEYGRDLLNDNGLRLSDTPVDLVLVEGYKHHAHDKIEVHRPSLGQPLVAPTDPSVIAIACDNPPDNTDGLAAAILDLNDTAAITQFILSACELDSHLTVPVGKAS